MSTPPAAPANKGKEKSDKKNNNNNHSNQTNSPTQETGSLDLEKNNQPRPAEKENPTTETNNNNKNNNNQSALPRDATESHQYEGRPESSATTDARQPEEPAIGGRTLDAQPAREKKSAQTTPAEACTAKALKEPPQKKNPTQQVLSPPPGEDCYARPPPSSPFGPKLGKPSPLLYPLPSSSLSPHQSRKSQGQHL